MQFTETQSDMIRTAAKVNDEVIDALLTEPDERTRDFLMGQARLLAVLFTGVDFDTEIIYDAIIDTYKNY